MAIFSRLDLLLLLLFLLANWVPQHSTATDHIVGANLGWNPNINYSSWSHNHTFFVGDLISFRYQKHTYNVFEVNKTGYDNCTMDGYAGNWTSGKDFIPLNKPHMYYFICNGFCFGGMKVSVLVVTKELPSPPSTAVKSMAVPLPVPLTRVADINIILPSFLIIAAALLTGVGLM